LGGHQTEGLISVYSLCTVELIQLEIPIAKSTISHQSEMKTWSLMHIVEDKI